MRFRDTIPTQPLSPSISYPQPINFSATQNPTATVTNSFHPHTLFPLPISSIMAASLQATVTLIQPVRVSPRKFSTLSNPNGYGFGFVSGRNNIPNYPISLATCALPTSALLVHVENAVVSDSQEQLMDINESLIDNNDKVLQQTAENATLPSILSDTTTSVPDPFQIKTDSISSVTNDIERLLSGLKGSVGDSLSNGESVLNNSIDKIVSSINGTFKDANKVGDNLANKVFSSVDQTKDLAGDRLGSFSGDLKEGTSRVGLLALDVLRQTIIAVEDYAVKGSKFITYSYGSAKQLFPPEVQSALNLSEEKAKEISTPVGAIAQQLFEVVEKLISSVGLDPSDPLVPFVLLIGTSSALWTIYWVATYSGYAGDLSPNMTMDLLQGGKNAVLIDARPEVLRERDGVPDLRRGIRSRYASVSLPQIDESVQKLLKSGREFDDALLAVIIKNLKNVKDRSKIIVMDADGTRSKGIARSLSKFGLRTSYRLQGGFEAWVKEGFRVKELKPETTLTILNEDAEAILEELAPTPLKLLGVGLGSVAAFYALLDWEKTLQLIGFVGIGQTIYRRVTSYEDSEDFKKDVSLILSPIGMGAQAVSWAAGKLESNGISLPTSPSSTDVQSRVLQAAAKHESQPSDLDGQDQSSASEAQVNDNVDFSEA